MYIFHTRRKGLVEFRWIDWNIQHTAKHGVDPPEAEEVILTGVTIIRKGRHPGSYWANLRR